MHLKYYIKNVANKICFFLLYSIASIYKSPRKKNNRKIVWFGAYGNSNKGDDLIFHALKKYIPTEYEINLSCRDSHFKLDYGVRTFKKGENVFSIFRNIKEFYSSSIFILGGGGLFESYDDSEDSIRLKLAYITPFLFAKIFGHQTMILGVGCNEKHSSNKLLEKGLTFLYSNADLIITRDEKSLRGLSKCCKTINYHAYWTFDPVFTYSTKKYQKEKYVTFLLWPYLLWPEFYNIKKMDSLSIQKREQHNIFLKQLNAVIEFVRAKGYKVIFPEFHFSDKFIVKQLNETCIPCDINRYMEIVGKSSLVITMRYHGQITSLLNHTPFISLIVQEKMNALIQNMDIKDFSFLNLMEFNKKSFEEMFEEAIKYDWTKKFKQFELFRYQTHCKYEAEVYNYLENKIYQS